MTYLNTLTLDGLTSFALIINTGNKIENRQPLKQKICIQNLIKLNTLKNNNNKSIPNKI